MLLFAERFLVVGILLRAWGPQTYSEWALFLSTAGVLSLGELGLNVYCGNSLQRMNAEGNSDAFGRMVGVALFCSLTLSVLLAVLGLAVVVVVDLRHLLSVATFSGAEVVAVILMLGLVVISRVARGVASQIYRGRQQFARGVVIEQISSAASIAVAVTAGLLGASPIFLAALYLGCDLVAGWLLMVKDLSKRFPDIVLRPVLPYRVELVEMWRQVRWLAVLNVGSNGWVQVPVLLLGYFGTTGSALVSFLVLRTLANVARQLATMLALSSGVEIIAVHYAGRRDDASRQLVAVGKVLSVVAANLAVAVALYGELFVTRWTGHANLFSGYIAAMLFGAALIATPSLPLVAFGIYGSSARPLALANLVQLVIGVVACGLLVPSFGANGAATGLAIGEAVALGLMLPIMGSRHAGIRFWSYWYRCVAAMVLTILWCGAVGFGLSLTFDKTSVIDLLISGVLWAGLGVLPTLVAVLSPGQRSVMAAALSGWMKRAS